MFLARNRLSSSLVPVALVAVAAGMVGCVRTATMEMPNPMVSKQPLPSNSIVFPDTATENAHGLPHGTLSDEAALTAADDTSVCFRVTLRSEGERADLAKADGWKVFLRGEPEFEDVVPTITEEGEPTEQTLQGFHDVESQGTEKICSTNGNCYTGTTKTTTRVPAQITVITTHARVCFANQGHVAVGTKEITLHLDDKNPQLSSKTMTVGLFGVGYDNNKNVRFRWKFL